MSEWVTPLTISVPILVAGLTTAGTIYVRRASKRTDMAAADKTKAETTAIEVTTARSLIEDLRKIVSEQRLEYEQKLATTRTELAGVAERQRDIELQQATLLAALAAHAPWDQAAWATLKSRHPEYPPPPPFGKRGRTGFDVLADDFEEDHPSTKGA